MNGRLTDRAILTDCLNSEKYMASISGQSALESASPFVRRDFETIGRECSDNVNVLFQVMSSRGWYSVETANQQSLAQAQQGAWSTLSSLGFTEGQTGVPQMTMGVGRRSR